MFSSFYVLFVYFCLFTESKPVRLETQYDSLLPGNKPRVYKHLLQRDVCGM